ncbi:MAG: hypothetical protein EHM36_06120 [Deltaproteobacteria bacterium]|nr:MAG: hypothetical protein EHM36_06120 [Deltaproteobacteria bacterium]
MRRGTLALTLALVLLLGYGAGSVARDIISESGEMSQVSGLLGKAVKNPQGEDLGRITGFVTGPEGRVAFAVLRYWVSDDTQKEVAVPFGALSCEGENCVLSASRETLDSAQISVSKDDLTEPKVAEDIYRYFGIQPYWTEEEPKK